MVQRGQSQTPASGAKWQKQVWLAQNETQEGPSEHKETHFIQWWWLSTGTGYPERLQSLHPWRYSNPDWTWSGAASTRWPCLSRGLGHMTFRGLFHTQPFCCSVSENRQDWLDSHQNSLHIFLKMTFHYQFLVTSKVVFSLVCEARLSSEFCQ